jgi:hypothetical protein
MHTTANLADIQWLLSDEAARWLGVAAAEPEPSVRLAARLRCELSAERAHLVLQQAELRRRGREKFAAADRMFFTPLGLEQATDERTADSKARRFAEAIGLSHQSRPSGDAPLVDLCCGIGGDLISLGRCAPTVGVDRDPIAALFAEANLACEAAAHRSSAGRVCLGEVATFSVAECRAWHIDPDRRPEGRRTTRPALHDPAPEIIQRLLRECPHAAVKLAPAAEVPDSWIARAELEWITSRRECRQLVAWFGDLARAPGSRRATVLTAATAAATPGYRSFAGQADIAVPVAAAIGPFVFEPDSSILAAGLCGALAAEYGLEAISARAAYLTGTPTPDALCDAALASFEVLEPMPLRIKMLRQWLRERGIGQVEVKKRGIDIDPQRLAAELRSDADGRATILIAPMNHRATAIVARRCR